MRIDYNKILERVHAEINESYPQELTIEVKTITTDKDIVLAKVFYRGRLILTTPLTDILIEDKPVA